jgi:Fur family transcriptional regulator, ferric uptake regulator
MTDAPETPKRSFDDIDGALAVLREHGLRISSARRLVLQSLFAADAPASAEAIAGRTDRDGLALDLASVYRNLETLERVGVVRHVHLGHGPGLYALAGGREREYLVCDRCGRVDAVEPARLERARDTIRADFGYEARFTHFPIVGVCAECAKSSEHGHAHGHEH